VVVEIFFANVWAYFLKLFLAQLMGKMHDKVA